MLSFSRRSDVPKVNGDWWSDTFSIDERAAIEEAFKPMGDISAEALAGSTDPSSIGYLVGHLKKERLRHLGYKLLARADQLVNENVPVLSLHLFWSARGYFFYRWRDVDAFALDETIVSFQRQIALAENALEVFRDSKNWDFVPAHAGYRQLRIIEEKRGNLTLARALCERAKA